MPSFREDEWGLTVTPLILSIGATNYKGNIVYMAEGQGSNIPSALVVMNPLEPYNTTGSTHKYLILDLLILLSFTK